jgi:DHA2 family multidrug resistance protein
MGRIDTLIDRRLLAAFGLATFAFSCWLMSGFDLSMGPWTIVSSTLVQGVGQAFANVPISTLAFVTLGTALRADASTISSLLRNLAGSVGISTMQWLMVFNGQRMHASLTAGVRLDDPVIRAGLPAYLWPDAPAGAVALNAEITRQSTMVAFVGNYRVMCAVALLCIPLLLLVRPTAPAAGFRSRPADPEPRAGPRLPARPAT